MLREINESHRHVCLGIHETLRNKYILQEVRLCVSFIFFE